MSNKTLPNEVRNNESIAAIEKVENGNLSLGPQTDRHVGIAEAIASLNIAESLQLLQLQFIETSAENRKALVELQGQIGGLSYVVGTTIEQEAVKMIASNEKLAVSNEYYAKWSRGLTVTLIVTTLFVGLLQAYVIWQSAVHTDIVNKLSTAPSANTMGVRK